MHCRYILEALRQDDRTASGEKLCRFGVLALEQFRGRFCEWPQFCLSILQIQHLQKYCPDLFQDLQRVVGSHKDSFIQNDNMQTQSEIVKSQHVMSEDVSPVEETSNSVPSIIDRMSQINVEVNTIF
jgi:hypothetical protein